MLIIEASFSITVKYNLIIDSESSHDGGIPKRVGLLFEDRGAARVDRLGYVHAHWWSPTQEAEPSVGSYLWSHGTL